MQSQSNDVYGFIMDEYMKADIDDNELHKMQRINVCDRIFSSFMFDVVAVAVDMKYE